MSLYYSSRRRSRKKKRQKELNKTLWAAIFLGFGVGCFIFCLPMLRSWRANKVPDVSIAAVETKTPAAQDAPGYTRLNPKCKPERDGVVRQLEDVLKIARDMDDKTPPFILEKVNAMLADIDSGEICVYSEQMLPVITPGKMMAMGVRSKILHVFLQTLRPSEPSYHYKVLVGITHERLHYEDNLPDSLENYTQGEVSVRKRVCDNGIFPLMAVEKGYIPYSEECKDYRRNEAAWEGEIIKEYTEDWESFDRYTKK